MNSQRPPRIDLLPLRLKGARIGDRDEYRVLRMLLDEGAIACFVKPRLVGRFFSIHIYPHNRKIGAPLTRSWFLKSSTIFPSPMQFYITVSDKVNQASEEQGQVEVLPELGFTTAGDYLAQLTHSESILLKGFLQDPLATISDIANNTGLKYDYARRLVLDMRRKLKDMVFCSLRKSNYHGIVQGVAFMTDERVNMLRKFIPSSVNFVQIAEFVIRDLRITTGFVIISADSIDAIRRETGQLLDTSVSISYHLNLDPLFELSNMLPLSHRKYTL